MPDSVSQTLTLAALLKLHVIGQNEKVLPDSFLVYLDPTQHRLGSIDLVGSYRYDNQGATARRAAVIEKGVFKVPDVSLAD